MSTGLKKRLRDRKSTRSGLGIRMNELSATSGLPKSAILHYVAQGLLPEPVRTGPNMAYYDPACIERIKFIKEMQGKYSFPLSKIRMLLSHKEQGKDVTPLIELSEIIFGLADGPTFNAEEFCDVTGLKPAQLRELMKNRLLLPLDTGNFDQRDVNIAKMYCGSFAMGARVADLSFYAEAAKLIVDNEMRLRQRLTAHLPESEDAQMTTRLVNGARAVRNYVIDRTFQQRVASARDLKDTDSLS